jgi:MFS family permease
LAATWVLLLVGAGFSPIELMFPGETSAVAPLVEEEFGPDVLIEDDQGYDGAIFWAVAQDFPALDDTAAYLEQPRYRFQRILTPALASVGGDGAGAAIGLLVLGCFGVGLGSGAIADLAVRHGRPAWVGLVFFFPLLLAVPWGLSEPLAFGLAMVGAALADRHRLGWAAVAFTLGALAREPVALLAIACAVGLVLAGQVRWRSTWPLLVPAGVVVAWMAWLATQFPASESLDRLDPFGLFDGGASVLALVVVAASLVAAWTWRDVPVLWAIGLLFAAMTFGYGVELFRLQVVYRAAAPAFALAAAGLLAALVAPRGGRSRRGEGAATDAGSLGIEKAAVLDGSESR